MRRTLVARAHVRWYDFVPEAVLGAGLIVFAVTEPHAVASAFKSGKALALMAAVTVGWLVARGVLFVSVRWPAVRVALFGLAALAVLGIVVLPAYDTHTVIETLPATASVAMPAAVPPVPVKVRSGSFRGIDHRAAGSVNLYRSANGHVIVGLEGFDIQPGPAYALYLVPGADRRDRDGGTRIGRLRGNRGTQFYDVPTNIDVATRPWTVLVWCETFGVPVANATPAAV